MQNGGESRKKQKKQKKQKNKRRRTRPINTWVFRKRFNKERKKKKADTPPTTSSIHPDTHYVINH